MSDISGILANIEQGNAQAAEQLLPLVYDELRRLAAHLLAQEKSGQTLQPTALVHEAYVRLLGGEPGKAGAPSWKNTRHFFTAAAEAMRRILIENARRKKRPKHGGQRQRVALDEVDASADPASDDLLALDEALAALAAADAAKAELVKLRYFAGLTLEQAAETLGISRATAARYWTYARAWLLDRMQGEVGGR